MKILVAIALIAAGALLLYQGEKRRNSLAGAAESFGKDVASAFDGKARAPEHTWYFAGGGALIVVGLVVALRRG